MDLSKLFVSQRKLRSPGQLCALIRSIRDGARVPPILVTEDDDGSMQIEDGHHRATAYLLSGRKKLESHEYVLMPRERRRPRFGRIKDLIERVAELPDGC